MRGDQGACACVVGGVTEVSFEPPPLLLLHIHKCVPAAIVTLSYSRTEGLTQTGSKQCLPSFVSRLPFFFSPPSQSTGLLCIDFPHSAPRQPLSAVFICSFLAFFFVCPPPPPLEHPSVRRHSLQCENAAPLDGMLLIKDT